MPRHVDDYGRPLVGASRRRDEPDRTIGDRRCCRAVDARDAREGADCRVYGEPVGRSKSRKRRAQSVERFE